MKLAELAALVAAGDTEQTLMDALAQRVVRMPDTWDREHEAAVCECGLLLVQLPRPIRLHRVVVTLGRPMPVTYRVTHVHAADAAGRLLCAQCADTDDPCPGHDAHMCDTPVPLECSNCADGAALPGKDWCLDCRPYEVDWDKDRYLGLE